MKFDIRVKVKDCDGGGITRPRPYVLFLAELIYDNKVVATSTIWRSTERDAINEAFSALARTSQEESDGEKNLTRTNYHPSDFLGYGFRLNGWGEVVREQDPERRASSKETWDKVRSDNKED
jgi:hypothetical protein